jgi:molybdenum cofactor cytidylyltransferase
MARPETVIILAAGSSSRLGQPKQLLKSNEVPLLLKTVQASLDAQLQHVIVVLGSNYETHKQLIKHLAVEIINHEEWAKGMGSSLKAGLNLLLKNHPQAKAAIVTVCDQPFITAVHLSSLADKYHETRKEIIASRYNQVFGVPALFDHSLFDELLNLEDTQGAKALIQKHLNQVAFVDWPEGAIDIDTPDDLHFL